MKYSDLVSFEPIESVIQLLDANKAEEARRLVSSYVISDAMADRIADLIFPQIGFDPAVDHKGILVVGNYGTGKSHLMSVLSTIAENADVSTEVRNDKVRSAAALVGGKFEVLRIEISSRMSLRDILVQELEGFLAGRGVTFKFPPEDKVTQNKTALIDLMEAFEAKFPGKGLLVVVDEMLDYLRSRRDTELVHDLSFLREIGEITKNTRFRFIGGVQEAIFDSARFASTADSLRRVKDRFQQVLIDRQDIGFVVAERLLRKDEHQRDAIRKHLEPYAKFYGSMGDRLDQFVRLFPVHPDYLGIFEKIEFAENRNALSTLSGTMRKLLDKDVPADDLRGSFERSFASSSRYYLPNETARHWGVDHNEVLKAVDAGAVRVTHLPGITRRRMQLDAGQVEGIGRVLRSTHAINAMPGMLGLPLYGIEQMIDTRLLRRDRHPAVLAIRDWICVQPRSLELLLDRLTRVVRTTVAPGDAVPLRAAARRLGGREKPWAAFVVAILTGRLQVWGDGSPFNARKVCVRPADMAQFDHVAFEASNASFPFSPIITQDDLGELLNVAPKYLSALAADFNFRFAEVGRAECTDKAGALDVATKMASTAEIGFHMGITSRKADTAMRKRPIARVSVGWDRRQLTEQGILPGG